MKFIAHCQAGLSNLYLSKMRSLLALLGILVGTASVVAMVLGGELATNEALKQFKTLGTDLLAINISQNSDSSKHDETPTTITLQQANAVVNVDHSVLAVAPYSQVYSPIQFNGHDINGSALGVTEAFVRIAHIDIARGRFISDLDGIAFYCVVGHTLYEDMKRYTLDDPIGKQLQIGKTIFTIVGIAAPWTENSFVYANIDSTVLIPIQTSHIISRFSLINNLILRLTPKADIDKTKDLIEAYFHQIAPDKKVFFRSAKEFITRMEKQSEILTVFLGLIGGVSLLVGGIGVMNIMLVSVVERRREIGIRLAVGATRADIRSLFLLEATMLSLLGGLLGVILGIAIAYVIALCWHWAFTLFLLPIVIGFSVSVATGVFFGFYPAYQASELDPIVALRAD